MEFKKYVEKTSNYKNGVITLGTSKRQPAWVAEIDGLNEKYGLNRKFINKYEDEGPRWFDVRLENNKVYNWSESKEQHFGIVEDGKLYEISKNDAKNLVK